MLPSDLPGFQQKQLLRYATFQFAIGAVIAVLAIGAGWLLAAQALLFGGVITLLYTLSVIPAMLLARRGRLQATVIIMILGLYLVALFALLVAPVALPVALLVIITAPILALPYFDQREMLLIAASCTAVVFAAAMLGRFVMLFPPLPEPVTSIIIVINATATTAIILLLIIQFTQQRNSLLSQVSAANRRLSQAQAGLERQVAERTAELQTALVEVETRANEQKRLLQQLSRQGEAIRELSVPILPITNEALVMPLIGDLNSERLQQIQERALTTLERSRVRHLILDITGVPVFDTVVAGGMQSVVRAARLLGARVWLVGVRPEVAQTIVGLGITLDGVATFATLREAVAAIDSRAR